MYQRFQASASAGYPVPPGLECFHAGKRYAVHAHGRPPARAQRCCPCGAGTCGLLRRRNASIRGGMPIVGAGQYRRGQPGRVRGPREKCPGGLNRRRAPSPKPSRYCGSRGPGPGFQGCCWRQRMLLIIQRTVVRPGVAAATGPRSGSWPALGVLSVRGFGRRGRPWRERRGCGRVPRRGPVPSKRCLWWRRDSRTPDLGDQGQVAVLDAFDQHGDAAAFEGVDDVGDDPGPGCVQGLELRHADDDDVDVADSADPLQDAFGRGEEQRPVEPEHGDVLVPVLDRAGDLFAVHAAGP